MSWQEPIHSWSERWTRTIPTRLIVITCGPGQSSCLSKTQWIKHSTSANGNEQTGIKNAEMWKEQEDECDSARYVKFAQMPSVVKFHKQFFGWGQHNTQGKHEKCNKATDKTLRPLGATCWPPTYLVRKYAYRTAARGRSSWFSPGLGFPAQTRRPLLQASVYFTQSDHLAKERQCTHNVPRLYQPIRAFCLSKYQKLFLTACRCRCSKPECELKHLGCFTERT